MALRAYIIPAVKEHAQRLGPVMRDADVVEVYSMMGLLPVEGIERAIEVSTEAWSCYFGGEIACIFGVAPVNLSSGLVSPWALTGEAVDKYPVLFYRTSRHVLAWLRKQYPAMTNRIDARNDKALRWARRVGFEVDGPTQSLSTHGVPHSHCEIRIQEVA